MKIHINKGDTPSFGSTVFLPRMINARIMCKESCKGISNKQSAYTDAKRERKKKNPKDESTMIIELPFQRRAEPDEMILYISLCLQFIKKSEEALVIFNQKWICNIILFFYIKMDAYHTTQFPHTSAMQAFHPRQIEKLQVRNIRYALELRTAEITWVDNLIQ